MKIMQKEMKMKKKDRKVSMDEDMKKCDKYG